MTSGRRTSTYVGVALLGGMVGDALGLPREGMPATMAARLFGKEVRHCLLPRTGMVSETNRSGGAEAS